MKALYAIKCTETGKYLSSLFPYKFAGNSTRWEDCYKYTTKQIAEDIADQLSRACGQVGLFIVEEVLL